ncbi:NAD-dependent succinate-semialdehyde dehydrogenase [Cupriavidus sp. 8B]
MRATLPLKDQKLLRTLAYIDGVWVPAASGATFDVTDPATGTCIASVPLMGATETRAAIAAAERAQRDWRARPARERAAVLRRWYELMLEHSDDLAAILTLEQGKPLAEAKSEILYAASFLEWFSEQAKRVDGDVLTTPAGDKRLLVIKEAIGVCGIITPWNFPAAMITRKVGPALAAGCAVVAKPAEATPLSAFSLAELAERAGVPPGIFSVVTGDPKSIGAELTSNPVVRKLSFTGSTAVGRLLAAQCAPTVKKLSLELGGNAPFIVFEDADLDAAVAGAVVSKFRNVGQTCVCANRLLVHEAVYDAFANKLAVAVGEFRVGNGFETSVTHGPLINAAAMEKVKEHIADAKGRGAKVLVGGQPHPLGGLFFEPTVMTEVTSAMRIASEETFGPVAPLFRFSTDEQAVELANATESGLAAYFYTRDIGRVWRVAESLEYGMVGINTGLISNEVAPFGGMKQSGLGREGSQYGIDEYLEMKYLCMGGI